MYLAIFKTQQEFFAPLKNFLFLFFGYLCKIEKKGTSCRGKWLRVDLYNYLLEKWIDMKESSIIMFLVLSAVKEDLQYLTLMLIDKVATDVLFNITCFFSLLFLTPQRTTSITYIPQTSEDLMHRLTVVGLLSAIFWKNVRKLSTDDRYLPANYFKIDYVNR